MYGPVRPARVGVDPDDARASAGWTGAGWTGAGSTGAWGYVYRYAHARQQPCSHVAGRAECCQVSPQAGKGEFERLRKHDWASQYPSGPLARVAQAGFWEEACVRVRSARIPGTGRQQLSESRVSTQASKKDTRPAPRRMK
jgi:hypothetical protein